MAADAETGRARNEEEQCSSLVRLKLNFNSIGKDGAWKLAGVLGQCSSLTCLDLSFNAHINVLAKRSSGCWIMKCVRETGRDVSLNLM